MRKYLLLTISLIALAALGQSVTAALGTTVRVGDLIVTGEGTFSPKALSRTEPTPVSLNISGKVRTASGNQPPAARKIVIEGDRNIAFTTEGFPTCKAGELQASDTAAVEKACGDAIIGKGLTTVSVKFPEQPAIPAKSPLLLLNGGGKGNVTTLYVHAYLTQPIVAAVVTTVKVQRVKNGRYGIKTVATIPMIAGGAGAVTDFNLLVNKKYTYKGKRVSVLTAKCPDGKLQNTAEAIFQGGTKAKTEVISTCTPTS
ncbi:MAG TPA: hypothetical protein VFR04_04370 [Solirubrobacterales bacterium]|nr:hypothetical protein [Solirubrobacterales bacterium]